MSNEVYVWSARVAFGIAVALLLIGVLQYLGMVDMMRQPFMFAIIIGGLAFVLHALSRMLGGT